MSNLQEFGIALKAYRVAANETVEDVSYAVEIDPSALRLIEAGKDLPDQDILELIISHLALKDSEAMRLFRLAGLSTADYEGSSRSTFGSEIDVEMLVTYTDMVQITSNSSGVVINFIQQGGSEDGSTVISRIGMSREQAKTVIRALQESLEKVDRTEQG